MELSLLMNPEIRYQKMSEYTIQLDIEYFKLKNSLINIDTAMLKLNELHSLRLKYQNMYMITDSNPYLASNNESIAHYKTKLLDMVKLLDNQYNNLLAAKCKEDFIFRECGTRIEALMDKLNTIRDFL